MTSKIPVIDLQAFPGETAKLIEACEEWGCFRIVNYEKMLPESLLQEMRDVMKSLFALPLEIKMRIHNKIPSTGYIAPATVNPHYEALGLYNSSSLLDIDDFCSDMEASPIQRSVIHEYAKRMNETKIYIAHKIGEGLGVKGFSFEDWSTRLRINKYNFTPETIASPGSVIHTDSSFFNIMYDDDISGLQVIKKSGEFVAVDPCPGTLSVLLGDIARVWSNGRFLNVKHVVICKEVGTRHTIVSFLMGPRAGMVEAPPVLVDTKHPRLFSPFTFQDYMNFKVLKKMYSGEGVDHFRIQNNVTNQLIQSEAARDVSAKDFENGEKSIFGTKKESLTEEMGNSANSGPEEGPIGVGSPGCTTKSG